MRDTLDLVLHVPLWNLSLFSSHLRWCGPLRLAILDDVAYVCTNIQQVTLKEENKKKEKTLRMLTHGATRG